MGGVVLIVLFFLAGGFALLSNMPETIKRGPPPEEWKKQRQLEDDIGTCDWKVEKALTIPYGKFAGCARHTPQTGR
jgi:hypothetical protein